MSVYFFRDESTGAVKIGYAKNVENRRNALQTGMPGLITVLRAIDGNRFVERWLHGHFSDLHIRGEWFRYSDEMLSIEPPPCASSCGLSEINRSAFEAASLVDFAGGDTAFGRLIGIDHKPGYQQRINNWKRRGMPASVLLRNIEKIEALRIAARAA